VDLPQASIADAYHLNQYQRTQAERYMSRLDQPVHEALEQAGLREAKGCENKRIRDAYRSQQAHTPAEKLYETRGQKRECEGHAHHHMGEDEDVVRSNQEQPPSKRGSYSCQVSEPGGNVARGKQEQPSQKCSDHPGRTSDPDGKTYCDDEKTSFVARSMMMGITCDPRTGRRSRARI
jgi:hypothetical protein